MVSCHFSGRCGGFADGMRSGDEKHLLGSDGGYGSASGIYGDFPADCHEKICQTRLRFISQDLDLFCGGSAFYGGSDYVRKDNNTL